MEQSKETKDGDSDKYTFILRPDLADELGEVWKSYIMSCGGDLVRVTVDPTYTRDNSVNVKLTIKASTRKKLERALNAIGVLNPEKIEPDMVEGKDNETDTFTATVVLTTRI